LHCTAVHCSVLQYIAVCCSVLQCATVYCSVYAAECPDSACVWVVALCCGVLHCVYTVAQAQNPVYMQTSVFCTKWHRVFLRSRIVHIHTRAHTHTRIHTHTLTPIHVYSRTGAHTHAHIHTLPLTQAHEHTHTLPVSKLHPSSYNAYIRFFGADALIHLTRHSFISDMTQSFEIWLIHLRFLHCDTVFLAHTHTRTHMLAHTHTRTQMTASTAQCRNA